MPHPSATLTAIAEQILARFPELGTDPDLARSLEDNVVSMIRDAHARYAAGDSSSIVSDAFLDPDHLATGALHAEQLQHPAGAMLAAEMLFDAYLPPFVEEVGAIDPPDVLRAARALHAGIWNRFPAGAIAYTEALRQRTSSAHLESRTQIARELHDRIAQAIIAGVQRVDFVLFTDPPAPMRIGHLEDAARLLRDALGEVQDLAVALHARVGEDLLDSALARHVGNLFPEDAAVSIGSHGTPLPMPSWKSEEALTILLEALTNWRKHAPDSAATVRFAWSTNDVLVTVADDGPGYDDTTESRGRLGLRTMQERATLIGARFGTTSRPGGGTTVTLSIPIGGL